MNAKPSPLRVLLVEDNPQDAELVLLALQRAGFDPETRHVDTEPAFLANLSDEVDLILSDYAMPQFSGLRALELLNQRGLDIPFILVSGTIGEDIAVAAMKLGATDYLLKDRLVRLGPAVEHALERSRARRERRSATESLRASEERFRELAENIQEVFWIIEPSTGKVSYISPAYEKIWGRTCESLLANPREWLDAVHPADAERVHAAINTRRSSGTFDETFRILRPDGAVRWIRDRAFPVKGKDGGVNRVVGVAEDITERKQLEAQFLRAQRMEAIGTLAGGVAHDLNNILAPMLMAAGLLKERVNDEQDVSLLNMMEQSARRGAAIIRQLLTFSRGVEGERAPVPVRHLLSEIAYIVRETFPREISLWEDLQDELWTVVADATQLHQVLMNLCVNARDAMPDGGTLSLTAANQEFGEREAAHHPEAKPGPYVVITVADTGMGIPPEILARIFDPFFTTKEIGKGTGLGLSTVLTIVRSHKGYVSVYSEPDRGTSFKIYIPAVPTSVEIVPDAQLKKTPAGLGETILVVDDEEAIRTATQQTLEQNNFRVLTAADGKQAVAVFLENRDRIRLVLTDVMMPERGGVALVRALRVLNPDLKIIATSGLETSARTAEFAAMGISQVLAKPCGPRALLEAIHEELHKGIPPVKRTR